MTTLKVNYIDGDRVICEDDHPRVYYVLPEKGYISCRYCEEKYARKGVDASERHDPNWENHTLTGGSAKIAE